MFGNCFIFTFWVSYNHSILGYEVDFGMSECVYLINSGKFSEKYTGYVATSILVSEQNNDLYKTVSVSIRNDL